MQTNLDLERHSTIDAITKLIQDTYRGLENLQLLSKEFTIALFLDLSKAFE